LQTQTSGQVPALTVDVTPAAADRPLSQGGGEVHFPRLRRFGRDGWILSNLPARPANGAEAYEIRVAGRYESGGRLKTLALSAVRANRLLSVALHYTGELDYLPAHRLQPALQIERGAIGSQANPTL